jgi:hypothetical protein
MLRITSARKYVGNCSLVRNTSAKRYVVLSKKELEILLAVIYVLRLAKRLSLVANINVVRSAISVYANLADG